MITSASRWPRVGKAGGASEGTKNGEGAELPHAQAKQLFSDFCALCHDSTVVAYSKWTAKVDEAVGGVRRKLRGEDGELSRFYFFAFLGTHYFSFQMLSRC